ncbi:MAG: NusG domain II-containing protein [Spirochaetes bacterium]|nr:NusG domain II-containing protein [Spirochaetota bacterium]
MLIILLLSWFAYHRLLQIRSKSDQLIVLARNEKFQYSLYQKKMLQVKGLTGITLIEIDQGKFRFVDSACSNKICVNHGWIAYSNVPVVCLPNQVTAYIEVNQQNENHESDQKEESIDGISY